VPRNNCFSSTPATTKTKNTKKKPGQYDSSYNLLAFNDNAYVRRETRCETAPRFGGRFPGKPIYTEGPIFYFKLPSPSLFLPQFQALRRSRSRFFSFPFLDWYGPSNPGFHPARGAPQRSFPPAFPVESGPSAIRQSSIPRPTLVSLGYSSRAGRRAARFLYGFLILLPFLFATSGFDAPEPLIFLSSSPSQRCRRPAVRRRPGFLAASFCFLGPRPISISSARNSYLRFPLPVYGLLFSLMAARTFSA